MSENVSTTAQSGDGIDDMDGALPAGRSITVNELRWLDVYEPLADRYCKLDTGPRVVVTATRLLVHRLGGPARFADALVAHGAAALAALACRAMADRRAFLLRMLDHYPLDDSADVQSVLEEIEAERTVWESVEGERKVARRFERLRLRWFERARTEVARGTDSPVLH